MDSESSPAEQTPSAVANKTTFSLEDAHDELDLLLDGGRVTEQEVAAIKYTLKQHLALREKVSKLKSLLGRSAKAQREVKVELEQTQRKLTTSEQEVDRLSRKVERLASRPTHMDLLADFESNFDRALLKSGQMQSGGQETTSAPPPPPMVPPASSILPQEPVDAMLLQELSECKSRIDHLESLNANYKQRSVLLEHECASLKRDREHAAHEAKTLQLELKMAQMETEHATRALEDKTASLQEMQLEIDLVTKASVNASVRAAQGEEAARAVLSDRQQVQQLKSKVQALEEWALASAEAKALAMEHVHLLERQLKHYKQESTTAAGAGGIDGQQKERVLFQKTKSLVVGAGDVGFKVLDLGQEIDTLNDPNERIVLRWKFDCTPSDQSVEFSLLRGVCDSSDKQNRADYLIKNRTVTGGAAGETESAFAIQNACTLLWSNQSSWVRPRTIKFSIDVVAIKD